ncbi:uncharacterized protein Cht6 isoform X2 [Panulirus ornatus]|uniref:uncharacterized protein Cht6 isoform X2 n=1 Tax=Panulirus ornatus TaxID=150431 RepID=UPI003A8B4515
MRFLLAAAAILAALAHSHEIEKRQAVDAANKVVCYYTNWSVYRKGLAKYTPQNINPYLCTHLVYAFGGLTDEFEIKPFDSYQDIEQGGYAKFNGLKQYNKGLKTLLAIGGWNEGSGRFSELVSLPEYRKTFIISAIKHLRRYNFDGLDLDWEYPASRDGSAPEDRENYATLVRELREAFDDEGSKVKQGPLLLTMAVPAGQNYIDKGYDIPSLTSDLDFFNILNYDYHSAYEPTVNHHAALMAAPGTSEYAWNSQLNVDWTVKYYISLGADKHKLVIGIPTYGRSYTLIDGNFTDFGASADGPGEQGKYTRENGFMAFYEVCENIASYGWDVRKPYPRRIGPYAYNEDQWVGYDDEKIVARKAEYVREQGLGGIMYWSLDNDDFRGICNGEQYPLVEAGKKALFSDEDIDVSLNEARALQSATGGRRTSVSVASQAVDDTRSRGSTDTRFKTQDRFRTETQDTFQTRGQSTTRTRNRDSFRGRIRNTLRSRSQDDARPRVQDNFSTRTPDRFQEPFRTRAPDREQDTFSTRDPDRFQEPFRTRAPDRAEDPFLTQAPDRFQDPYLTQAPDRFQDPYLTQAPDRFQDPFLTQTPDRFQDPFLTRAPDRAEDPFITQTPDARVQEPFRTRAPSRVREPFNDRTQDRTQESFSTRAQDRSQASLSSRTQDRSQERFRTRSQDRSQASSRVREPFTTRTQDRSQESFSTRAQDRSQASLSSRTQDRSQERFRTRAQDRSQASLSSRARDRSQERFRTRSQDRTQDSFSTTAQDRSQTSLSSRTQESLSTSAQDRSQASLSTRARDRSQERFRTRAQDRTQDTRRQDFGTTSQSSGTQTRGGTSFGTSRVQASRPPRIRPSARTPGSLSSRVQNRRRLTTTTSRPARLPATTSTPRGTLRRRRPGIRRGQRKQATTTTIDPLNTPAPPTTPSPVSGFSCKREGFYPNPDNCHKYYWCLDSGASGLGIVAHAFTCPSDLVFSKTIDGCDHPTRTKCSTEKKSRGGASATTPKPSSGSIPTTTEIPVDYSYLDDIYVDDEYYYDYEDSTPGDLPEPVEEVPNTVSRRLQNSGGNQFTRGSTSSKSSSSTSGSARETTSSSGSLGGRSRPQYTSISRDRSRTSQAAATDSSSSSSSSSRRQEPASTGGRRPEYTTIRRQRPAAQARPAAEEEVGQAREAEPTQGGGGGREYVVLERRRPQTSGGVVAPAAEVSAATPAPIEELYPTQPTLEYVTIDRSRGRITPDSPTPPSLPASEPTVSPAQGLVEIAPTSPRYVTIERGRFATEEEITTTTTEETTVVSDPAAAGATHDALPNEDYNYYDDEILTTETGSSDLTLPSSSPPPPPPPSSQTTTTTTSSTTTTTTSSPITTTTTTNERNTTITTAGRPTRTRTRLRGRPVGSQAKRLGASVDGVSRRTSNTQSRLPSKPLRNKTGGEKGKAERKEEVLKSTPGVLRRPPPRRPTGSSKNNRRRILVRKRIGVIGASGQAEQTTSGPVRIRTRPPTSPRTNPSRTFTRPRLPRPQLDDASLQPESRQRPSRPLIQISPRPSRPSADGPRVSRPSDRTRLTRPSADNPRATRPVDGPRPVRPEDDDTRPQLSTAAPVLSATASPVEVARDEEAVTTFDEESLSDTTVYPESTVRPTLASLFPKPQATTTPAPTTPAPTTPAPRTRSRPSPRTRLNPRPRATSPRPPPRSPRPQRPAFAKIPVTPPPTLKPAQSAILAGDYTDYYYDDLEGALTGTLGQLATLTEKAILMADGSVQCYDTGYFSHPDSCKKFISCSKTVRGLVRGWVYTCPQQLVFDPVGGMCNWAESVDCEGRK